MNNVSFAILRTEVQMFIMRDAPANAARQADEYQEFRNALTRLLTAQRKGQKIGSATFDLITEAADVLYFTARSDHTVIDEVLSILKEHTHLNDDMIVTALQHVVQLKDITHRPVIHRGNIGPFPHFGADIAFKKKLLSATLSHIQQAEQRCEAPSLTSEGDS